MINEDIVEALAYGQELAAACTRCPLNQAPYEPGRVVFGIGSSQPQILFVGEGPGEREAKKGLPFVGPSGNLLQEQIVSHGLSLDSIYITNVVKHRPPGNRPPQPAEVLACSTFLKKQIALLNPVIIVALGAVAARTLNLVSSRPAELPSHSLRGTIFIATLDKEYPVLCTWHPAYCLRQHDAVSQLAADIQLAKERAAYISMLLAIHDEANEEIPDDSIE